MEGKSSCCIYCGKHFGRRVSLISHQKVCQVVKQELPSSSFNEDEDEDEELDMSLNKKTRGRIKVMSISCNLCGQVFKQKGALQSHVKVCSVAVAEQEDKGNDIQNKKLLPSQMLGIKAETNSDPDLDNVTSGLGVVQENSGDEQDSDDDENVSMSPSEQRRTYNKYSHSFKLQVIAYAKVHSKRAASKKFNVPNTSVRRWISQENQVKKEPRMKCGKEIRAVRNVPSSKLEEDLKRWVVESHKNGEQLTKEMITEKAIFLADERNLSNFTASRVWYFAFLSRHQLDHIVDVFVTDGVIPELPGSSIVKELTCEKCGLIFKYRPSLRSHMFTCMSEIDKDLLKRSKQENTFGGYVDTDEDDLSEHETTTNYKDKNRKNKVYTKEFKLRLIYNAKLSGNRSTGRKYGVPESLIRKWREEECTIRLLPATWNNIPRKLSQVSRIKKKYKKQTKKPIVLKTIPAPKKRLSHKERKNYKLYTCHICNAEFKVKTVFDCHMENCSQEVASNEEAKKAEMQLKLAQIKEKNKTKKKSTFPAGFKLQLIQEAKLMGTANVAKKYNLCIGTVNRWRHREKILQKLPKEKVICLGGSKFPLLESRLRVWMEANARLGKVLTRSLIKRHACRFSESMKLYDFMCSDSWLKKFFQRNQLSDKVRVITNVVPYICEMCGKSLKTDTEFEHHMSRCNPTCIDYAVIEIPDGIQSVSDKGGVEDPLSTQNLDLLTSDLQNNHGDFNDLDDVDVEDDSPPASPPLLNQVTGMLHIKQEIVSPDDTFALNHQTSGTSVTTGTKQRAGDDAQKTGRLNPCGSLNEPQLARIFEFLDHVKIVSFPSDNNTADGLIVKPSATLHKRDSDTNYKPMPTSVDLPDDNSTAGIESDDNTVDMVDDEDPEDEFAGTNLSDSEEKYSKVKSVQDAAKAKIGPFTCGDCARVFSFKPTFEKHMKYHESKTKYECHVCEETFAFKMQLLSHMETHKRNRKSIGEGGGGGSGGQTRNGEQEHMCERCGRYLKGGPSYRYHMKLHFREDQAKCPQCSEDSLCSEHLEEYRVHLDSTLTRPVSFKLKMIDLVKQGGNKSEIARKYDVALNSLRKWIASEDRLRAVEAKNVQNFSLKRKYDYPEIESRLHQYLIEFHRTGVGITNDEAQEEARKIAAQVGNTVFKPTIPWLASFKDRFKNVLPQDMFICKKATRVSRKSYSIAEKAEIVSKTEELGVGKTAKQLGLPRSTIRKWVKNKRYIFDQVYSESTIPTQYTTEPAVQAYEETVVNDGSFLIGDILNEAYWGHGTK